MIKFSAIYDFREKSLQYINCGHNEIMLKMNGEIKLLSEGTTILGMINPLPFINAGKLEDISNFFIFAYTDGLTETFDEEDEAFEFERLKKIIEDYDNGDLNLLQSKILSELNEFKGSRDFHDDITMLSCKVQNE